LHSQQAANIKMLARLRLDQFIRTNNQQHQVNPRSPCKHVFYESLMSPPVNEYLPPAFVFKKGESQIDRDSAAFLFLQAVWMRAGQRLDQRGLSMIDMTCGPDDGAFDSITQDWTRKRRLPEFPELMRLRLRRRDFVYNLLGCGAWVRCRQDRASNDDKIRARANRFPRCRRAGLIIFF